MQNRSSMQNSSNLVSFLVFLSLIQFSFKSSSVYFFSHKFSICYSSNELWIFWIFWILLYFCTPNIKTNWGNNDEPGFYACSNSFTWKFIQNFCCPYWDDLHVDLNPATTKNSDSPCLRIWGPPSCLRYLYGSKEYFVSSLHSQTLYYQQVRCLWSLLKV